jgi:hypothetical protein
VECLESAYINANNLAYDGLKDYPEEEAQAHIKNIFECIRRRRGYLKNLEWNLLKERVYK